VVDKRQNPYEYERIKDITGLANRIAAGAGLSANIELVPNQIKLGGNGPIMANGLIAQGHEVSYIGALGKPVIHPVFHDFVASCRKVISIADPGHTDALEFMDGKIMMGKLKSMVEVNMVNLLKEISVEELTRLIDEAELGAFTNWTMLTNMTGIIEGFSSIIGGLEHKPKVFLDLADPRKRTDEDILSVLKLISEIPAETVLSVNLSESTIIGGLLGVTEEDVTARAAQIREKLGITGVVIHPLKGAAVATATETVWVDGPYTETPKLTTGAGDNFNSGFCNGWMGGFAPSECLAMGVCTSGYYVRNEGSPSHDELLGFMKQWADNDCGEI
jgi:sugar/nucleoside kinase (ribokinase family)